MTPLNKISYFDVGSEDAMGRGVMGVVTELDGKARIVRKFKRRRGCSSPRQLCLSCRVVIHPNDKSYASKVCRSCAEKSGDALRAAPGFAGACIGNDPC